jgi:hypothetical protein
MARKPHKPTKSRPKFRGTKKQREALTRRRQSIKARKDVQALADDVGIIERRKQSGELIYRRELTDKDISEYNRLMRNRVVNEQWIKNQNTWRMLLEIADAIGDPRARALRKYPGEKVTGVEGAFTIRTAI